MMWIDLRRCLALLFVALLSACSGGGGSGVDGQLGTGGEGDPIPPNDLPISGTARYDGFLTLGLPTLSGRQSFTGALGLDVNFDAASAQITGEANQFRSGTDEVLAGRIMVTNGEIDRTAATADDYTFEAGLSGTLSGTDFRNIVVTGTLLGDFNGEDAATVSGTAYGDVVSPLGFDIFNGTFSGTGP